MKAKLINSKHVPEHDQLIHKFWGLNFTKTNLPSLYLVRMKMYLRDREICLEREQPHDSKQYAKTLASPM
jgi:hypothetical protein